MSWSGSTTHVSDQAQAHFGDILGNVVHVYQYPRAEPPKNAHMPALCEAHHRGDPRLKRLRLQGPYGGNEIEVMSTSQMNGLSQYENIHAILRTTYEAPFSELAALHHKTAAMCTDISELTGRIQHLISDLESVESSLRKRKRRIADSSYDFTDDDRDHDDGCTSFARTASCVKSVLGCVSTFNSQPVHDSICTIRQRLSGTPYCSIAQSSSCHAEFYTVETPIYKIFVAHIARNEPDSQTYFLAFQRSDRQWVRAKTSIASDRAPETTPFVRTNVSGNLGSSNRVPYWLEQLSQRITELTRTNNVRVNLKLELRDQRDALMVEDKTKVSIVEDIMVRTFSADEELIKELCGLQVSTIPEFALVVFERHTLDHFGALLNGQKCQFHMAPFTSRTEDIQKFKHRLHCLVRLRGCLGVTQLIGLVTDHDKYHLRGYCSQCIGTCAIGHVLSAAVRIARPINWAIRLQWIRKIVAATAELHDRGTVIGPMTNVSIRLTLDRQIVVDPTFSYKSASIERDRMAIEIWGSTSGDEEAENGPEIDKGTDIYQVGLVIWQIAEHLHRGNAQACAIALCARASCTSKPRYLCRADHTRPRELPPCNDAPSLITHIVRISRSKIWKDRPSARRLLEMLSEIPDAPASETCLDAEIAWHIKSFVSIARVINCDECSKLTSVGIDCHYHCYICFGDDFDLYQECYEDRGVRCLDPTHRMTKRYLKDGVFHELSY